MTGFITKNFDYCFVKLKITSVVEETVKPPCDIV